MVKALQVQLGLCFLLFSTFNQAAIIHVNAPIPEAIDDGLCSITEAINAANTDQQVDGCAAGQVQIQFSLNPSAISFLL